MEVFNISDEMFSYNTPYRISKESAMWLQRRAQSPQLEKLSEAHQVDMRGARA